MTNTEKVRKKFSELAEILGNDGDNIIAIAGVKDETAPNGVRLLTLLHGEKTDIAQNVARAYRQDSQSREILHIGILASIMAQELAKSIAERDKTSN